MSYSSDASLPMSLNSNSQDPSNIMTGEHIDEEVPVVIVPVRSFASQDQSLTSPATGSSWYTWCRRKPVMLALAIPFVVAFTIRLYIDYYVIDLSVPQTSRIIDINSPPVDMPSGETIATLQQQQHANNELQTATDSLFSLLEEKPIPLIVDRGEVPVGVGGTKLTAADALMCRESVINYVINATNGKDECTGLQKAFDETCSQEEDEVVEVKHTSDQVRPQEGGLQRERRRLVTRQKQKRKRKFNAMEDLSNGWGDLIHKASLDFYWLLDITGIKQPKFMAENAVFRAFSRAKRRIIAKEKRRQRRRKLSNLPPGHEEGSGDEKMEHEESGSEEGGSIGGAGTEKGPGDDDDDENEIEGSVQDDDDLTNPQNATSSEEEEDTPTVIEETEGPEAEEPVIVQPKPHTVLNLPTGHTHVSAKTLEKTLLLQQEDKVMLQVKKAVNATVNATKTEIDPKEDAAASAKAVADTNELVSAVLNDPSSIEARACCASILNVYHENCNVDAEEEISDKRLFIVVLIMAFCGMVKSLIRHYKIRWLPEAAGCILVGVASGFAASYFPHQDFSFDGNWFLRILVPPIVFEAALSIDKKSFHRHLVPIIIYSTIGTVFATFLTASIVYNGTRWMGRFCESIPYIESLIFGSLISSIDPIAVLSVLSNMGMTDTDTLYVLVFGESLLNDGVAIVLFHTLVEFLDANVIIDSEAVFNAVIHFFVVALGSILVGIGSGIMCTIYYWAFHGCQTPLVEVLMFLCWALLPYYVADGIGWSGIVSSVTVGFVMDMYVIGLSHHDDDLSEHSHRDNSAYFEAEKQPERIGSRLSRPLLSGEGHLSPEARIHIHFVTEIVATMMETAIFAYLGLFLFSHRYHWNVFHVFISIMACCLSRAIMIPMLSGFANWITSMQKYRNKCRGMHKNTPAKGVIVDTKMQMVLWFAGLRGAMSFALVEHIPLFDAVTGDGTRVKAELKAMTSASIMFTVFVLGGSTNYFMDYVGLSPKKSILPSKEMTPLVSNSKKMPPNGTTSNGGSHFVELDSSQYKLKARQRPLRQKDDYER